MGTARSPWTVGTCRTVRSRIGFDNHGKGCLTSRAAEVLSDNQTAAENHG